MAGMNAEEKEDNAIVLRTQQGGRSATSTTRAYRFDLNGSALDRGAPQLEVKGVTLRFGGVQALRDVAVTIRQGEIHAIIGPNGAGKTSLLNCVNGLYRPQQGSIKLHNGRVRELTRARPSRIARWGVARSFQNIELFRHMTVVENLLLGRHVHMRHYVGPALIYYGPARRQEIRERELVEEVIDFLELQAVRKQEVGTLSYGFQKRVELGRALCMQPAVLLLDEPMAGMNAEEKEDMARYILDVNELAGVTVVLIEHDMSVVMDISRRITAPGLRARDRERQPHRGLRRAGGRQGLARSPRVTDPDTTFPKPLARLRSEKHDGLVARRQADAVAVPEIAPNAAARTCSSLMIV
jgi:branched-chain amino acid transport system ATP-binding protein